MRALHRVLLFLCLALPTFAQQGGAPDRGNTDRRILLDVVVADKAGKPVPGLKQSDFAILDNKHPQNILSFQSVGMPPSAADPPIEIILLVDAVNTSFENLGYEREQIAKALRQNGGQLVRPITIDLFVDPGTIVRMEPSQDGNALVATLAQNETSLRNLRPSQGLHAEEDLIQMSLDTLRQFAVSEISRPGRKMVIWISPGWPLITGPHSLDTKDQQRLFESVVSFSTLLRQARITSTASIHWARRTQPNLPQRYMRTFWARCESRTTRNPATWRCRFSR